jgi:hypothetical protein
VIEGEEVGRITSIAGDAVLAYVSRGVDLGESVTPAG